MINEPKEILDILNTFDNITKERLDKAIETANRELEVDRMSKKTIVFDFDGVIHTGYKGWKDGSIYGAIDCDLLNYIEELIKDYYIVISSNRPAEQIVTFMNHFIPTTLKFEVFNKNMNDNMYWNKDNVVGVTNEKAVGILYIDDRGYRYNGVKDLKNNIERFLK